MNIPFRFSGLQSLKIKETDRIEALKQELHKLGYVLKDSCNSILEWDGERCEAEENPQIVTYEDHRMAMAFAPLALVRPAGIEIMHPEVVSKKLSALLGTFNRSGFPDRRKDRIKHT